jgi:DNA-binding response OmpR family regulator
MLENKDISILLAEDDPNLSLVLKDYLEMLGYHITLCRDGFEALSLFKTTHFDLCIFDVMMPRKDGFTLAREIRDTNDAIPIIFLTAKSLKEDRVKGFKAGCDDYITKPFSTEELSLRISAILKRCMIMSITGENIAGSIYKIGTIEFDAINMVLRGEDFEKKLTRKETSLLKLLVEHRDQLLTRDKAMKKIWGGNDYFIGRSMDVFIAKLRSYLKVDPNINIVNVHGTGFRFQVNPKNEE